MTTESTLPENWILCSLGDEIIDCEEEYCNGSVDYHPSWYTYAGGKDWEKLRDARNWNIFCCRWAAIERRFFCFNTQLLKDKK